MNNVFLAGEKIDLCIPDDSDFEQWAEWFNSQSITQYLEQGKYPNTPELQRSFYQNAIDSGRFLTLIKTKDGELLGVISLSEIDYEKLSCQVAYVCPVKTSKAILAPLEALALCTQHAFERFGMHQVWAGHSYPGLESWILKTQILGYKAFSILPDGFRHGITVSDAVKTSINKARFLELLKRRGGLLWPGEEDAQKLIRALKKHKPLAQRVAESIKTLHSENDQLIDELENNIG